MPNPIRHAILIRKLFKNPKLVVSDRTFYIPNVNDYSFAKSVAILPLGSQEVVEASKTYPILFVKDAKNDVVPIAIMGLKENSNLFINKEGKYFPSVYIPALFRSYPFGLAQNENNYSLVVDEWALEHYPASTNPFFNAKTPTKEAQAIINFVQTVFSDIENTKKVLRVLDDKNLLKQMDITIKVGEEKFFFKDFLGVDMQKLKKLSEKELGKLYKSGVITIATLHSASLSNFKRLGEMYER